MGSEVTPELMYGQGLYVPANANYYGYDTTGVEAPVRYDHQNFFGLDGQELHYAGLQTEGSPYVYYTPDYGYAHSSYTPYSVDSSLGVDGSFVRMQEYLADPANPAYHQTIPLPYYLPVVLPSATDSVPISTMEPLLYSNAPFISNKPGEVVKATNLASTPVASLKAVTSNPPLQSTVISSKQFQDPAKLSKVPVHNSFPAKQSSADGAIASANLTHITQAPDHFLHGRVPSLEHSLKANPSANNGFGYVGSDLRKWISAEKFQPRSRSSDLVSGDSRRVHLPSEQNLGIGANRARGQRTSAMILKAYTSKIRISSPEGNIIISTDQYNKDDFPVEYAYAKFFVIKSYSEDDVHKSIKYGVWSSTPNGNKKLNSAYEDAQRLSARNSIECPVFLFFSVNGSGHFCGVAEMVGPVDFQKDMDFWHQDKWTGSFPVKWHIIKDVPNTSLRQILLENNENRPVTHSRDTQEIPYIPGTNMLKIFKDSSMRDSILDDFMKYEEIEARFSPKRRSKLSHDAPVFIPAYVSQHAHSVINSKLVDDTLNRTRDAAEMPQVASLNVSCNPHPDASSKSRDLVSQAVKESGQKESHSVCQLLGSEMKQDDHLVSQQQEANKKHPINTTVRIEKDHLKTTSNQQQHYSDGKQQSNEMLHDPCQDGKQSDGTQHKMVYGTSTNVPSKAPKKNPNGVVYKLVVAANVPSNQEHPHGSVSSSNLSGGTANSAVIDGLVAAKVPDDDTSIEPDQEGSIVGKIGSLAISSRISGEADCPSGSVDVVTIGSVPVMVKKPGE